MTAADLDVVARRERLERLVEAARSGTRYSFCIFERRAGIDFIFNHVRLHRIMANYMPANVRSAAVLARLCISPARGAITC